MTLDRCGKNLNKLIIGIIKKLSSRFSLKTGEGIREKSDFKSLPRNMNMSMALSILLYSLVI